MFSNPPGQAFFPRPGRDDAPLSMSYYAQNCPVFDEPFLENQAFIDSNSPRQPLKPHEQAQQFSVVDNSSWRDANGCAAAAQHLPTAGYGQHELSPPSWANSQLHASTLTELPVVDYSELYTLPQEVFSQYPAMAPAAFDMALSPASSAWAPAGSSPHGMLSADSPLSIPHGIPYFPLEDDFTHFTYEPQSLESQAKSLFPEPMDSYVLPQAVHQPAPPVPSVASTPSFGDLSPAASLADVSDMSDTNVASPASPSSSGASASAGSPTSAFASPAEGKKASPAKGKAPNTRSRATRQRTRLPSVTQSAPSPASTVSAVYVRTRSSAKKQGRAKPTVKRAPITMGAPYRRIQDMDPATRAELDRLLVAFRARGTPYKVIMDRLRHIYLGNHNTLRGRLRTLTLAPKMRVRNPVWEDHHIELLKEAVADKHCKHPNTHKTSWTRVSEYMHDKTGPGSYKFSVTACSRKWQNLTGGEEDDDGDEEDEEDEEYEE
ncbi:hypothetical protein TOPH_02432 [Tolypocladium ophioglossoides CBS 100239]|uniref:Myb-like domain-containing protein n=1 Tax=Tolypocladium ophioglossoides (strain CBS 100239) TaxID=1163406 RepID=A0A0L0NG89_TOLOC|nr:hypothetical protein TOPH_02432 [Tolypocladium ophioglossoides CBS 100239]